MRHVVMMCTVRSISKCSGGRVDWQQDRAKLWLVLGCEDNGIDLARGSPQRRAIVINRAFFFEHAFLLLLSQVERVDKTKMRTTWPHYEDSDDEAEVVAEEAPKLPQRTNKW